MPFQCAGSLRLFIPGFRAENGNSFLVLTFLWSTGGWHDDGSCVWTILVFTSLAVWGACQGGNLYLRGLVSDICEYSHRCT